MSTSEQLGEKAARAARTTLAVLLAEIRFVVGTFARASLRAGAIVSILMFMLFAIGYVASLARGDAAGGESLVVHVAVVLAGVVYSLFIGVQGGLALALPWTAWKLAGPWIVVPLVTIPIFVALALLICSPLTAAAGDGLVGAIVEAGGARHWLVGDLGPAARIGPIVLVLALPLLLIDLGAVMLAPSVLLHLVLLLLALALGLALGLIPSGIISIVAITIGYVRRFARRHGETIGAGRAS